ncbi:titin-like, partial [Epinephelus moara]|uniref:titin-like n=1 Tax=Epinephelus moara TaxID=300413 RepID=UPI00214F40FE
SQNLQMAALGRPFSLGMLYDCRHEKFIPGMTLWNYDDLVNYIGESPQQHSDFEIVASESIEDKSSALNVEGSLKASLFFGLMKLGGSAKYLCDNRIFKNQARVTLKYEATTKFQELSMNHLGNKNVKYPDVFTKGIATHVVTAILYGAQAFFVFDREVSDMINREEAEGFMRDMIKKIPFLKTEGDLSLKLEEKDFKKVEEFSCKFHGDFLLEKTPSTFQDAIQVYQSLPKLLGANGENAVPVKVWLLPLTSLDPSAAKLVREISAVSVEEVQAVLEEFSELEMRCNDILRATEQQFPQIGKKIETFKEVFSEFRIEFHSNLAKKLPSIRGGEEKEAVVTEILKKRHSSLFNSKDLNEWMDCKEREICILKSFTNMMKNTKIVPSQSHLYKETHSAEHAVCFVFTSLGSAEPYLSALSNYLKQTPKTNNTKDPHTDDEDEEQWYTSKEVLDAISHKAKLFSDFAEANKENKNIKFLTAGSTNETQKGSSIYLYEDGRCVNENFEPPSKPETVTVTETNHKSVTLKISPPKFGAENITSYSVEYCVSGDDGWKQKTASEAEEVTVSDLSPNTEYMFRCRAVTSAGVGPANEVSGSIKTLPCSPPGKPQVEPTSSEISVSWEKPAEVGQNVHILSYIVEYANKDNSLTEEDLQWIQIMTKAEKAIISGLQPETEYVVRVRCDCGEAGGSKESITVTVCTTQDVQVLQDVLKDLTGLEIRCKDAINSTTVKQFPQIAQKIETFKKLCTEYKLTFPQRLTILRGESKEAVVMDMMKMRNSSPFNETDLCKWMDCKEREIHILKYFTDIMQNTNIVPSQDAFQREIVSAEHAVCFVFTSLGSAEPFLSALSNYLTETPKPDEPRDAHTDDVEREQWYTSKEVLAAVSHKAKLFSDFAEANKENKNIKFLTVGSTNETQKGSSIYLYEDGFSVSENFEPPSKSETVTVTETNHKSVTLKISPPKFGAENITSYSVEYCVSGDDGWKQKTASEAEEVTVSDLSPNTEYMFRCRAVTSAGVGPANEISGSIKTLPRSPPGKPQVDPKLREIKRLVDAVKEKSKLPKLQTGSLLVYKIPLKEEQINVTGCKRFSLGKEITKPNRTIVVLGATGAGKSTLINGMINYILGVQWEDSYRFMLVDEGQSK